MSREASSQRARGARWQWLGSAGLGLAIALGSALGACTTEPEGIALEGWEDCTTDEDEDGDGLAGCADSECAAHPRCRPFLEYDCTNGRDDNGDGRIDCEDPSCAQSPACGVVVETNCEDGIDNDGDTLVDCVDPDCTTQCWTTQYEICNDEIDNDGDGAVDCEDADCTALPACRVSGVELCNNDVDDNGDGAVDCADPACQTSVYCAPERCNDAIDNNGNGLVDCEEDSCLADPACAENATCQPATAIQCGMSIVDSTVGRLSNRASYPCSTGSYTGGERYYRFEPTDDMNVSVHFVPSDPSMSLFRLTEPLGGGCTADACLRDDNGTQNRGLTFDASALGNAYIFAVDGLAGAEGAFSLSINCLPATSN